jgi:predicted RNA-binding protein with PIN domain
LGNHSNLTVMPRKKIIIDGYNLIKANPDIFSRMTGLESQRRHLQKILQSAPALHGQEILIVFDGASGYNLPRSEKKNRMQVIFSGKAQEADEVIQNLIRKKAPSNELLIVSSDQAIQNTAKDHQAASITSREFWKSLLGIPVETSRTSSDDISADRHLSEKEVQDWLKIFKDRDKSRHED